MNAFEAAALYVGLNIFVLVTLTVLVIRKRRGAKAGIGDGGNKALALAIRAHANAAEVMPMALIGLITLANAGVSAAIIHVLGVLLTAGRIAHAYGLSTNEGSSLGRVGGMALSLIALVGAGVICVVAAF
jgi:uncharacterized protein